MAPSSINDVSKKDQKWDQYTIVIAFSYVKANNIYNKN